MGLQSELEHIAYDSIPILLFTIIAAAVCQLRSVVFKFIHRIPVSEIDECLSDLVGTVLASLIVLAEQLNLNIACSNELKDELMLNGSDCVVCLCELRKGERVRRLECRHVFHKKCLDGWLKQLHFSCPLCRSPVPPPTATVNTSIGSLVWNTMI